MSAQLDGSCIRDRVVASMLSNQTHGITYLETTPSGEDNARMSIGGLIAVNYAQRALQAEQNGVTGVDLFCHIATSDFAHSMISISACYTHETPLTIGDDILGMTLFASSLERRRNIRLDSSIVSLHSIMQELRDLEPMTRSAAAIISRAPDVVVCLRIPIGPAFLFAMFNPYPRVDRFQDGASLTFSRNELSIAELLFRFMDTRQRHQPGAPVNGALQPSQFSAILLTARLLSERYTLERQLLAANLQALQMRHQLEEATSTIRTLRRQSQDLRNETVSLQQRVRSSSVIQTTQHDSTRNQTTCTEERSSSDSKAQTSSSNGPHRVSEEEDESYQAAISLQRQIYEDNDVINAHESSHTSPQAEKPIFECAICFVEHSQDDIAALLLCGHKFCRDCLRQHVLTKIDERRYPILCPGCTEPGSDPFTIDESIILTLGIDSEQYRILETLQLSSHSVSIHCPSCRRDCLVERDDFLQSQFIECPLQGCFGRWCRLCDRLVGFFDPPHSCDGTLEFLHLAEEQGWKRCPVCQATVQKTEGCNHITCTTAGCNAHWCYLCGQCITRSLARGEINGAVEEHYEHCRMYDGPAGY